MPIKVSGDCETEFLQMKEMIALTHRLGISEIDYTCEDWIWRGKEGGGGYINNYWYLYYTKKYPFEHASKIKDVYTGMCDTQSLLNPIMLLPAHIAIGTVGSIITNTIIVYVIVTQILVMKQMVP